MFRLESFHSATTELGDSTAWTNLITSLSYRIGVHCDLALLQITKANVCYLITVLVKPENDSP